MDYCLYHAFVQYFIWIEYALLDGNSHQISSWFFKWTTWMLEGKIC